MDCANLGPHNNMELQQEDITESNQSAEPALSSPQPPPIRPLHLMPIRALQTFQTSIHGIDSDDLSITNDLENFKIRSMQPSSVTTDDISTDLATSSALSLCSFNELKYCSDASQAAFLLPPGSSGLSAGSTASDIPVVLHELASSRASMKHMETLREDHVTDFAEVTHMGLICSVCGKESATWKDCAAEDCKGQAWCDGCNSRWHSRNPRRKAHQPTRIRRELICAICASEPVKWKDCPAAECKGQAWCDGCNTLWHSDNPKRKEHQPTRVVQSEATSPCRDPAKTPFTEVQGSHQNDFHFTSTQQSSAASATATAVQSASTPHLRQTLAYLAELCDGQCLCASRTLDGRLLVGRINSLEIRAPDGKLLSHTRTKGVVRAACELMGRFYWLIDTGPHSRISTRSSGRRILVLDRRTLKKIFSWTLPDSSRWPNMAVLVQTLVVPDPDHSQLLVYSSEGQLLSQHEISSEPWYVSTSGTDVIVSDWSNNTLSVYDTRSSAYRLKFSNTKLEKPTAAAVSSDGRLYVGSLNENYNKLLVLSATGQLITELHHERLSWCEGLNITGDQLLAATGYGLYLYQLGR